MSQPESTGSYQASVVHLSYFPLGDVLASGSSDRTIRLWDTSTHRRIGVSLQGHNNHVISVDFSPDGDFPAPNSTDKTVRLWDVQNTQLVSDPFEGHASWVDSATFSPNGTLIASASGDKTICIWDVESRRPIMGPLHGHANYVQSVAFSTRHTQLISGSADLTLLLWDTWSGSIIGHSYRGHTDWVNSVSFAPNGIYVTSGSNDQTIRVWDIRTGRQVYEPFKQHTHTVYSVAFSPSGSLIASGSSDSTFMIWNVSSLDSNVGRDSPVIPEDDTVPLAGGNIELIGRHMSAQDMFTILTRHGCVDLAPQMDPNQPNAVLMSRGVFGDIWKGELLNGTRVAVKRATREIYYWPKMKHENVHQQLTGLIMFKGQSLGMVSEWMENGNIHEYLRKHPNADRYQLSIQVVSGLAYIHTFNMVHGDIKASAEHPTSPNSHPNLPLLNHRPGVTAKWPTFAFQKCPSPASISLQPLLHKLGLSDGQQVSYVLLLRLSTNNLQAPELQLEETTKSKESDIYALGMTIYEIFTGNVLYYQHQRDYVIMQMVGQGKLPTRPANEPEENERGNTIWNLLVSCWIHTPSARPSAQTATASLASTLNM
ncbi:WD40-repeat-containing domain protein [Rhizoctonia solani]|nr:WD40-repeat-containing domain protein [Rhizoctonia solani]